MAEITGNAESITGGQDLTVDNRSLWNDGLVARATRATCNKTNNNSCLDSQGQSEGICQLSRD